MLQSTLGPRGFAPIEVSNWLFPPPEKKPFVRTEQTDEIGATSLLQKILYIPSGANIFCRTE